MWSHKQKQNPKPSEAISWRSLARLGSGQWLVRIGNASAPLLWRHSVAPLGPKDSHWHVEQGYSSLSWVKMSNTAQGKSNLNYRSHSATCSWHQVIPVRCVTGMFSSYPPTHEQRAHPHKEVHWHLCMEKEDSIIWPSYATSVPFLLSLPVGPVKNGERTFTHYDISSEWQIPFIDNKKQQI